MHAQPFWFFERTRSKYPDHFNNKRVLEVGALDTINYHNKNVIDWRLKSLFNNCDYTSTDLELGPNVDLACETHNLNFPDETFDTIISSECFEHDMFWQFSIKNIIRMLKPGGLFTFSTATTGRPIHGTEFSGENNHSSPFTIKRGKMWANFYKNFEPHDFLTIEEFSKFRYLEFEKSILGGPFLNLNDLYFRGIKLTDDVIQGQIS